MRNFYRFLLLCVVCVLPVQLLLAQGATTSALKGQVNDQAGMALPGATVIAVHQPTNTQYVATTNSGGYYTIQNMRVGGPYTISTSYIGYQEQRVEGVTLALGKTARVDFGLSESSRELGEVQIVGERNDVFNQDRTGAATNVSREQIENLPTITRSLQDFTRLTPQASGNSIAGSNNRFNNITIDGAVNNDVFGLSDSGTPGGQAGTQPISLDAIQEIQVVVAPYDVKLGNFTGGGVNAITRSGTNTFSGSVYGFGQNEDIIGKSVVGPREKADEFKNYQFGVRIGGPIVRDKLFFFFNYDASRFQEPVRFAPGSAESQIPLDVTQDLADFVLDEYGYDVGSFGSIDRETKSDKFFGRIDWNINAKHQLTLRHNVVDAFDDNISRSSDFIRLGNNAYRFNSTTNSSVLELNSRFSDAISNKFIAGYTRIRESRETAGELFPQVTIFDPVGTFEFGSQRSSVANELDQDIFEFTNNLLYTLNRHTFTIGTHNEFFSFRNLFINNFNGRWEYNSIEDFVNDSPRRIRATYSLVEDNLTPAAEFDAMQLGFYVQDEYTMSEQLKLTLGLRVDIPVFPDKPAENQAFENNFASIYPGLETDRAPSGELLWAPRFGFNYTPSDSRDLQIRGGTGIFSGRVPFVWLSNQFTNTGTVLGTIDRRNPDGFVEDVNDLIDPNAVQTFEINVIEDDFKLPQVWRSNLAVDYTLPHEIFLTVEGIYSKTLNDVVYKDLNLEEPEGTLQGGPDDRLVYPIDRRIRDEYTNVILLDNTDEGYRYSLTGQLRKNFVNGLQTTVAYTYGKSKDVNSGTSSTALSNYEFNQIVNNPNDPELSFSRFDIRHRIIASAGYTFTYGSNDNLATGISLFYQGQSGLPFTYLYNGDLNRDGNFANDLIYVPRTQDDINLVAFNSGGQTISADAQWEALNDFIENDDYLSERRGQYAERNGARMPWTHQVDLRVFQDFVIPAGDNSHKFQITFDIFNVGNLLNRDWGHQYFVRNSANEIIRFAGRNADTGAPEFTFNPTNIRYNTSPFDSRWRGQIGLRYLFNDTSN